MPALLEYPLFHATDSDGFPLSGGFLWTYEPGTSTPTPVYTNALLTIPHPNPVILDAAGEALIYFGVPLKATVTDAAGVAQWTIDPVLAPTTDPAMLDDISPTVLAYQTQTDPGELGSENLPASLAGELERLRYAVYDAKRAVDPTIQYWYETPPVATIANVKAYGAVGDGVANDTAAIQAAALVASCLYFPAGTYLLSGAIVVSGKSFRMVGEGRGISVVRQMTAGAHGLDYTATAFGQTLEVSGLTLQAGVAGAGDAVHASWPVVASTTESVCLIENVDIRWQTAGTHYWTNGVVLSNGWNSTVRDTWIGLKPPVGQTFNPGAAILLTDLSQGVIIAHNQIFHAEYGILVQGTSEGPQIHDNVVVSVNIGISLNTPIPEPGSAVVHNHCDAFTCGIHLVHRTDLVVQGNLLYKHNQSTQNYTGIQLVDGTYGSNWCRILGNKIAALAGASGSEIGIVVGKGTWCVVANNTIANMDAAVWLQNNSELCTVSGNRQSDCANTIINTGIQNSVFANHPHNGPVAFAAGDTTPRVDQVPDSQFLTGNTSATTINMFDNGVTGQVLTLRIADANTTIAHGLGINLLGTKTTLFRVGTVLQFRFDGAVWYEVGPQNVPVRSYNATGTLAQNSWMVTGSVTLVAGAQSVTLSGGAQFSAAGSYVCVAVDVTAANAVRVNRVSGSQIDFAGTGTDVIHWIAIGN